MFDSVQFSNDSNLARLTDVRFVPFKKMSLMKRQGRKNDELLAMRSQTDENHIEVHRF